MKAAIEPLEDFRDDKPIMDWGDTDYGRYYRNGINTKARLNRPQQPKPAEMLSAALIAFAIAICFWVALVCFFV